MGLISRLWNARSQTSFDKFVSDWYSGSSPVGESSSLDVSGNNALKYNVLFACCRILGETFATVPIFEYKKVSDDERKKTNGTGVYDVLHNAPNDEMSPFNFNEMAAYQINLGGNFVARREYTKYGELLGLYPWEHSDVSIEREDDEAQRLIYSVKRSINEEKYYRHQIFHVPGPSLNGIVGLSPIKYAADSIRLGMNWEMVGNKMFKNGTFPTGVFEHPGELKDVSFNRLKEQIDAKWTGQNNIGKPIITEDAMKFTPLKIDLQAIQMIESRRFSAEDICRIYRVPMHLVQDLSRSTNNNIEHQSLEFVMYTMLPWFKRWEDCINSQLLTRQYRDEGYYFEYNVAALLRGDQKSMAEAFAAGRMGGWLSVNDIRRMLNMNKIEHGDTYLQPMNMVPAGTVPDKDEPLNQRIIDEIQQLIETKGA